MYSKDYCQFTYFHSGVIFVLSLISKYINKIKTRDGNLVNDTLHIIDKDRGAAKINLQTSNVWDQRNFY